MSDPNSGEAAFMGRMTAGVTHEMKNVLAIIKESAGLIDDLLALTKDRPLPNQERLTRVLSNIKQQVDRGVDLSTRLNAFAHCADARQAEVDLNTVVDAVTRLLQRFARLKGVVLSAKPQAEPVILVSDPLRMHMLLVDCVDCLLAFLPTGTTVRIEPLKTANGRVKVSFSSEGSQPCPSELPAPSAPAGLLRSAEILKGTIEPGEPPVWLTLVFD